MTSAGDKGRKGRRGRPEPGGRRPGDPGRTEAIEGEVRGGRYRVEPEKVADKMVDDAVEEVRRRRRRSS